MDTSKHTLRSLPEGDESGQSAATGESLEAALTDAHRHLHDQVVRAILDAAPELALATAIDTLVRFAAARPHTAQLLVGEAMGGGSTSRQLRADGVAEIAGMIERAYRFAPAQTTAPDVPTVSVIGGVYRLLDSMLHGEEPLKVQLGEELAKWLASYTRPLAQHRWRALRPLSPALVLASSLSADGRSAPAVGPADSQNATADELAASERHRVLLAAAEVTARGYEAASVAAICAAAQIDEPTFYRYFSDKRAAFRAVHELHYQQVMTTAAGAFFSGESWSERVWLAGSAFASYMQANPALLRATLVEGYAGGPPTLQRGEDIVTAFTIFLQEGYQHLDGRERPSRLALAAIGATIFEIGYEGARTSLEPEIAGLMPHAIYVCLAPFLGPEATDAFIDARLRAG
ncbi:MAG TPA: TetR family transcriptional regulator [Solirubrobacteraceae bacterium]|nr:TetR family transcriptional regulator [Solirubrobacteraceae bacterium]